MRISPGVRKFGKKTLDSIVNNWKPIAAGAATALAVVYGGAIVRGAVSAAKTIAAFPYESALAALGTGWGIREIIGRRRNSIDGAATYAQAQTEFNDAVSYIQRQSALRTLKKAKSSGHSTASEVYRQYTDAAYVFTNTRATDSDISQARTVFERLNTEGILDTGADIAAIKQLQYAKHLVGQGDRLPEADKTQKIAKYRDAKIALEGAITSRDGHFDPAKKYLNVVQQKLRTT